jgi:hypothetical protein
MVINSQADDVPRWQCSVKARVKASQLATPGANDGRITDRLLNTRRLYLVTLLRVSRAQDGAPTPRWSPREQCERLLFLSHRKMRAARRQRSGVAVASQEDLDNGDPHEEIVRARGAY